MSAAEESGDPLLRPVSLDNDVFMIDTVMAGLTGVTAAYLIRGPRPTLIETGTALSAPTVIQALASCGLTADDLAVIVVTHIHLDHAGGVGALAQSFPSAQVYVHERGARHLADPRRLMAGTESVYGTKVMGEVFGTLTATCPSRIHVLADGDAIDLGQGRFLECRYTPGHAKHHLSLVDSASGDAYLGDAGGVYISRSDQLKPATPPADFDLGHALASLDTVNNWRPHRLLFTHYGPSTGDIATTLERAATELRLWVDIVAPEHHAGATIDHAVAMVQQKTAERYATTRKLPAVAEKFERVCSTPLNVAGIYGWLDSAATPTATVEHQSTATRGHLRGLPR